MALLTAMASTAQNSEPRPIPLTDDERQWVASNNDFALRLLRETLNSESNLILSPLSITNDLGMLNNGAAGKTLQEISHVLGFGSAGADALNQFCRTMMTANVTLDPETKVLTANNIYMNTPYQLKPDFLEKAATYYNAQPETRNFADGLTRDVINQWGSNHTEGMIKEVLRADEFNPNAVSYLLNALYFKGCWQHPFDPALTQEEEFHTYAPQSHPQVPMMHIVADAGDPNCELEYMECDAYQAVKLPYGNGAFLMTVFLPIKGDVSDVLGKLNGQNWQFHSKPFLVDLKMPRFETSTDVDLVPILSALGMPSAFIEGEAEFPDFCDASTYIGMMKQVARLKLDEQGTEAAAVTVIEMDKAITTKERAEFHANRPFLYIISEQSTGVILFIGTYMGQESSSARTAINVQRPMFNVQRSTSNVQRPTFNLKGQQLQAPPVHGLYVSDGKKVLK